MPGGADAQIGWVTEVTPGTALTVSKFMPFRSETIRQDIEYMDTQTLAARHTIRATKRGIRGVAGGFSTELPNTTLGTFLKHAFGSVITTGAGPYAHTFTPGSLTNSSMTVQVGRPASTGTVHPFTYAGMKVSEWTVGATVGELATLEGEFIGMTETTATTLATASYDSTWSPFSFTEASLTVAGSAASSARSVSITGKNAVEPRHRLNGSGTSLNPLQVGLREYGGTVSTDFDSLTDYNRFVNGTEAALVVTFSNGVQSLVFTMNVQFVGETPTVGGFELLEQSLPYRCFSGTSDAAAITAVLTNSEVTV